MNSDSQPPQMVKCGCECHTTPLISIACGKVYRHRDCRLDGCECDCHKKLAADGQPTQVEERCRDCSDARPCTRILCDWCFNRYGVIGLRKGTLTDTRINPRPPVEEAAEDTPEAQLDWVRSLNPSTTKPAQSMQPRLVRGRAKVTALSGACGIEPYHHGKCKEDWCKCACHDSAAQGFSLACTARDHGECKHSSWCKCKCHEDAGKGGE